MGWDTGHITDAATGLVYMQQRYYDPRVGRLWSVDPVTVDSDGGNFNRYWYAANNPYKFNDPDGRAAHIVAGGVIGGLIGGGVELYKHAQRSEEHTSELQSLMRHTYAVYCLN